MAIRVYKPTSAGRRRSSVDAFDDITKTKPEKSLIQILKPKSGRNNQGKLTVRHKRGGAKKFYRIIDFKQQKFNLEAEVLAIEYDPNRGPRIALIQYADKEKAYILCPEGLKVGDKVMSSDIEVEAKLGYRLRLQYIPVGMFIYNIELTPGKGGKLVRGAGLSAQLLAIDGEYVHIKLPSGEIRKVLAVCYATVGTLGNADRRLIRWGKAGRNFHRGIRPTVKGKNMNPCDHPHGGGEGHSPIGQRRGPQTVYGKTAMGPRTRNKKKWTGKLIVRSRHKAKKK
jgi:large subunit ribosomal protein L2